MLDSLPSGSSSSSSRSESSSKLLPESYARAVGSFRFCFGISEMSGAERDCEEKKRVLWDLVKSVFPSGEFSEWSKD
jgi:hypothetical protein